MIGMLWYDNQPNISLDQKVQKAAEYYQTKYGQAANVCYVNQTQASQPSAAGLEIRGTRQIMPNHFWLGVDVQKS